jgi:hypothetical protein
LLLVAAVLMLISSFEFDRTAVGAGVGLLAGGVVVGYLAWRVLPWPGLRGGLRYALREDSAPFSGVSLRERLVVLALDMVAYGLLILIVGWVWATVISTGIYAGWVWLANRSGR